MENQKDKIMIHVDIAIAEMVEALKGECIDRFHKLIARKAFDAENAARSVQLCVDKVALDVCERMRKKLNVTV